MKDLFNGTTLEQIKKEAEKSDNPGLYLSVWGGKGGDPEKKKDCCHEVEYLGIEGYKCLKCGTHWI